MHFTLTPVVEPVRLMRSQLQHSDTSHALQHSQMQLLETKWVEKHLGKIPRQKVAIPLVPNMERVTAVRLQMFYCLYEIVFATLSRQ